MVKTKKKNSNKKKRSIRNNREAKKYIDILNRAYMTLTSSFHEILDKNDYVLLPYLKTGFKRGWNILNNKNIIKEIKCNSLCMTISILNSTLGKKGKFTDLNPLQKLYLFFISYLVEDGELSKKEVNLKQALYKIELQIIEKQKDLKRYTEKGDNRNIKKCNKYIENKEKLKQQLIESGGKNKEGIPGGVFNIDVCNNVDCEYLHEYQMKKGQKYSESYSKLCLNITELFKGIVWLNMHQLFGKIHDPLKVPITSNKLDLNLNIRNIMNKYDIIFLPEDMVYDNEQFYENNAFDQIRKKAVLSRTSYWVYNGIDMKNNKLIKKDIKFGDKLENKHYIVAHLNIHTGNDWRAPYETKLMEMYKNLTNFEKGIGSLPILKDIQKQIKNIGGQDKYDLAENIKDSITLHWMYMHRDNILPYIQEFVI
jgi:hypothetical protein